MVSNIFWLGTKELRSFFGDLVLVGLVIWSFSFSVYSQAQSDSQELRNASVGIVDEDRSELSRLIRQAILPPWFRPPVEIPATEIGPSMDASRYVFVIEIPPKFEQDVISKVERDEDRRELEELCRQVRLAMGSGDKKKMDSASAELNDRLLNYAYLL